MAMSCMSDTATETATATEETKSAETEEGTFLVDLLGPKLVGQGGAEVATADLLKNDIVSFYFSAHWCPPCRGFTPKLAETYKKVTGDKKAWDVIFVSSDKDQDAFDSYFAEHPWKALPYDQRKLKATLSKKYKVQGIPTLIMINPRTGEIWNKEGRSAISGDPNGANFPWENRPKPFTEILKDMKVTGKDGNKVDIAEMQKNNDYIAVYTSAHWCPPCRGFTPTLIAWYKKYQKQFNMELIFSSWDRDAGQFKDYWNDMPWPARDFDDKAGREGLDSTFEINGIPSLVIVEAKTGKVVCKTARAGVSSDPEGFPWMKKAVAKLDGDVVDALNSSPCCYAICDAKDTEAVIKAMTPAAEFYVDKLKKDDEWPGEMEVEFIVDNGTHGLSGRVKGLLKLKDDERLFIMDLSEKKLFNCEAVKKDTALDADTVSKFLADYRAGSLKGRDLEL